MAKVLKAEEMLEIIKDAISGDELKDKEGKLCLLDDLAVVIGVHFGADAGGSGWEEDAYYTCFRINDYTPADGGVFSKYDTDVTWKDGEEEQ
jgi:hypothetical protein